MNKTYNKYFVNTSIFYACLLPLVLLAFFTSGCSNNQSDSIQAVVSRDNSPLAAPILNAEYRQNMGNHTPRKSPKNFYKNPILIKAKSSQLDIQPSLKNHTLQLGNSSIENWPLGLPTCQYCRLDIAQKFHPDGPDTLLTLSNKSKGYQWGVMQSGQKQVHLLDTKLAFNEKNELSFKLNNKQVILLSGQTYHLKNCTITPLWIETPPPLSAAYSDDQAKHKIQILFECQ